MYLPAASSIAMAAAPGHLPDLQVLALFGLGSFLMRGAGCTVNDMWDKDIDRQVVKSFEQEGFMWDFVMVMVIDQSEK